MRKLIVLLVAALAIPASVAIAKGPPPGKGGKSAPKVVYILKGKLSGFTAYNKATNTPGSITIVVSHSNYHGKALKTHTLTFTGEVMAKTRVKLHRGATTIADGDRGVVKVKAAKRIDSSALLTTLEGTPVKQIIDKRSGHGKG
jgi:hypothetical protein